MVLPVPLLPVIYNVQYTVNTEQTILFIIYNYTEHQGVTS